MLENPPGRLAWRGARPAAQPSHKPPSEGFSRQLHFIELNHTHEGVSNIIETLKVLYNANFDILQSKYHKYIFWLNEYRT